MSSPGVPSPAERPVGVPPPSPTVPKLSSDDGVMRGSMPGQPLDADPIRRMDTISRAFKQNDLLDQTSDAPTPGRENFT